VQGAIQPYEGKYCLKHQHQLIVVAFLLLASVSAAINRQLDSLLIIMPKGELFQAAKSGLIRELKDEFVISTMDVNEATSFEAIDAQFVATSPRVVVLMGNRSIALYSKYSSANKGKTASTAIVAILALDVKRAIFGLENVQCIAYETPMITALVNFRHIINQSLETVGVIYRRPFAEFMERHIKYCNKEKIMIKSIMIGDDASAHKKEIAKALDQLIKKEHIQAFWMPNDNILLKPELLMDVWLPVFGKKNLPVIVGVESLVKPEINFGTYAVIPDPEAMGEQAAGLIADIRDQNWKNDQTVIYPAISMYSVLNFSKAELIIDAKNINMNGITKILRDEKNSKSNLH
jgi:hypothetical protein